MTFKSLFQIDVQPLIDTLPENDHLFSRDTARPKYPGSAHHSTQSIYLRGPVALNDPGHDWFADVPHIDYHAASHWPAALDVLEQIEDRIGAELGKAMIVSLKPQCWVDWHVDEGPYAEAYRRGHLPILSNDFAHMYVGQEAGHLPPGRFFEFNNRAPHSATNFGTTPRVHLIVDWRKA